MKPQKKDVPGRALRLSSLALAVFGILDSIYLLILKYTQAESMCIGNHGCITVNFSPYSMIGSIPVSVYGILGYLVIAGILFLEPRWKTAEKHGPLVVFGASLAGVLFSAYLTYIEYFVIFAVCPFCIASAVAMTLIFILAVIRLAKQTNP